jgi:hypothetical protein
MGILRSATAFVVAGVMLPLAGCTGGDAEPIAGPTINGLRSVPSAPAGTDLIAARDLPLTRLIKADGMWAEVSVGLCEVLKGVAVSDRSGQPAVKVTVAHINQKQDCPSAAENRVVRLPDEVAAARVVHDEVSGTDLPVPK